MTMLFRTFIRQERAKGRSVRQILDDWNNHRNEGTFLNGEHSPIDSLAKTYVRHEAGCAFSYQVLDSDGKEETYLAVKRFNWNSFHWVTPERPMKELNVAG